MFYFFYKKYRIFPNAKTLHIYCISDRVAKPLRKKNFNYVYVAKKPNQKSLIATIKITHLSQ